MLFLPFSICQRREPGTVKFCDRMIHLTQSRSFGLNPRLRHYELAHVVPAGGVAKKRLGEFSTAFHQLAADRLKQCDHIVELAEDPNIVLL